MGALAYGTFRVTADRGGAIADSPGLVRARADAVSVARRWLGAAALGMRTVATRRGVCARFHLSL